MTLFFLQGTTADQDNRFSDKKKKLMKSMKFNDGLEKKVSYKLCLFNWSRKKRFLVKILELLKKNRKKMIFLFSESKV